jgi:tetratricopeptide (TPR) repeat protein
MASRVNTRFVVLLVGGVVGLLGLVLVAYMVAFKSAADNIREGDRQLAEGNVKLAERAYSKAVNKESTNVLYLDKWIESLEQLVPETETEYRDRFFGDYTGSISKKATVLRNDVDAHERLLRIYFEQLMSGYTRGMADRLIEQTTTVLGFFSGGIGDEVQDWERLKRYRGIAITQIMQNNGVIEEDKIELGIDDLSRAIQADPSDSHALTSLMALKYAVVDRNAPRDQQQQRIAMLEENLALSEEYLALTPDNTRLRLQKLMLEADLTRRRMSINLSTEEIIEAMEEPLVGYQARLTEIAQDLYDAENSDLNLRICLTFAAVENAIDTQARFSKTRRLLDILLENDRENAETLYFAGSFAERAGDNQEANAWYEQINDLSIKPLSYAGYRQFFIQRQSLMNRCGIYITQHENALTDVEREEALTAAKELRDEFSELVSGEDLSQLMLNGRIARAEKQFDEALRVFRRYNEQTQKNNSEGLWYEGMVASELAQYGVARDAFERLERMDGTKRQIPAMLMLAQLHTKLQNLDTAARYYQQVLDRRPDMQIARTELERLNLQINPELNEDPALAAIYTARKLRMGDDENPGDYAGAIEYLREQVVELDHESRVTRELASLLLDRNDIEGARALLSISTQNNPEDEGLLRMLNAQPSRQVLAGCKHRCESRSPRRTERYGRKTQ